jgi:DNA-binding XRE family transcriptional regulator
MSSRGRKRRLKKNRHYTYEAAAEHLNVTPQTIRSWRSSGLQVLTNTRPHLILGEALSEFLDQRDRDRSRTLALEEFLCFSCKKAVKPLGMMTDLEVTIAGRAQLTALCETCEARCHKYVSATRIEEFAQIFDIEKRGIRGA